MRIERVMAHSFGPFSEQQLEFSAGMTVVYGPNESGKSTWHAAMYLALCGLRRGPGSSTEAKELTERHKPWDLDGWAVSTVVSLEDGRRIELAQDLENKIRCSAVDADMGRDYSGEVINEGTPDGSLWLGLDRRSFRSTACVCQVEIQDVLLKAGALQEHLQRAAATAGTDATAAAAISCLADFKKERIGRDIKNSTKPLRTAVLAVERAHEQLARARQEHIRYVEMVAQLQQAEQAFEAARTRRQVVEAAETAAEADSLERRVSRVRALLVEVPIEPENPAKARAIAQEVENALHVWKTKPAVTVLEGPSSEQIKNQLSLLPDAPEGDTALDPSVEAGERRWRDIGAKLEHQAEQRPTSSVPALAGGLGEDELRQLAGDLSLTAHEIDPELEAQWDKAKAELDSTADHHPLGRLLPVAALAAALLGAGMLFVIPALGVLLLAISGALFFVQFRRGSQATRARTLEELRRIESELGNQRFQAEEVERRRAAARIILATHDLPIDVGELTKLAQAVRAAREAEAGLERWTVEHKELTESLEAAERQLRQAVQGRGCRDEDSLDAMLVSYKEGCLARQVQAVKAAERPGLQEALDARKQAETAAEQGEGSRISAERGLAQVAIQVGLSDVVSDNLSADLERWLEGQREYINQNEKRTEEWQELQTLLDGSSLEDLEAILDQRRKYAEGLSRFIPRGLEFELKFDPQTTDNYTNRLQKLRDEEARAAERAQTVKGSLVEYSRGVTNVAEAEEDLEASSVELSRIQKLDQIIEQAENLLQEAQERTHRTIAPLLRNALERWLPSVTSGRYSEALVDPDTLRVQVRGRGSRWRDAHLLSHGTAEQIYLLLRVAMAEYLTRSPEKAPLLLDDVTVQADVERKEAMLTVLKAISAERQVVLFSQELDVYEWAKRNLIEPEGKVICLPTDLVSA
jgi:hypothetical protein